MKTTEKNYLEIYCADLKDDFKSIQFFCSFINTYVVLLNKETIILYSDIKQTENYNHIKEM